LKKAFGKLEITNHERSGTPLFKDKSHHQTGRRGADI